MSRSHQQAPAHGSFGDPVLSTSATVYGIALALLARGKTGQGQLVTTSLLHAALAMQLPELVAVERAQDERGGEPLDYAGQAMFAPYRCRDGRDLVIVVIQDEQWRRLCGALGRPDLADDARYATALDRARESAALGRLLADAFAIEVTTIKEG